MLHHLHRKIQKAVPILIYNKYTKRKGKWAQLKKKYKSMRIKSMNFNNLLHPILQLWNKSHHLRMRVTKYIVNKIWRMPNRTMNNNLRKKITTKNSKSINRKSFLQWDISQSNKAKYLWKILTYQNLTIKSGREQKVWRRKPKLVVKPTLEIVLDHNLHPEPPILMQNSNKRKINHQINIQI